MIWPFDMSTHMVFWIVIGVIAVSAIFFRYRESVSRDRTLQTLAEKGQPIPPELLRRGGGYYRYRSPLRSGIILVCIGIAIFIASNGGWHHHGFEDGDGPFGLPWQMSGAIFPLMIGVALLLIGIFERRPPPPGA
ncbi:MAG: hypothetical protein GC166_14040 [Alphaproteobacteria bacterium]|nr:hypothetical protein [Alphaproteobacteria bacterium]